jgi:NodT family efflux transporter outer membrane factor (OMF) lipoprotein
MIRYMLATAAILLGGCTVGPDFKKPEQTASPAWGSMPGTSVRSTPVEAPIRATWWELFRDPELTSLEERVAAQNLDVQTATMRLAESRAQLGIVAADAFPTLQFDAQYQNEKASNNGVFGGLTTIAAGGQPSTATVGGVEGSKIGTVNVYQAGFDASWEIDLWGKVRRSVESAKANVTASEEARRGVLLSSLAEVARDYLQLRGAQLRQQIARDNVRTAQQSLELTRERAAGGVTTDLDVANAAAQVSTFQAQLPLLEQQQRELTNALSFLLGQPPQALARELAAPKAVPPVPPHVPVGVPSELVERRPDIQQAEAQLHAVTATIGVAEANFYPSFTLSAGAALQSLHISNFFSINSGQYNAGPFISLPIFEGGQLTATLQLRKDQQKEAAIAYRGTVLNAWQEVDNALTAYESEQRRRDQLVQAVAQNERALSLAQQRYQQGVADFLNVLDTQRSLLATQDLLALSTTAIDTNLVAIYKALGGGWETTFPRVQMVAAKDAAAGE